MNVVHFSTEVSGGAGSVVANIHKSMLSIGIKSHIVTREASTLESCTVIVPLNKWQQKFRALNSKLTSLFKIINPKYALFGIQKFPLKFCQIRRVLDKYEPKVVIFYWTSYFISYQTILEIKQCYKSIEVFFICLDEAFLTGGCHYSSGCEGYQKSCLECPATNLKSIKNQIKRDFETKIDILDRICPTVIYPSSKLKAMGMKSSALKNCKSYFIPLGALFRKEMADISRNSFSANISKSRKLKLLVRSSNEDRKGCDLFLSALEIVNLRIPNLRERLEIYSVGDDYFAKSKISQIINYKDLGIVNRATLLSIYSNVDALVVSSREDSGPLMINECVASGVFVISTPVGVANDLIISDKVGIVARAINKNAIADALLKFLKTYDSKNSSFEKQNCKNLTFEGYSLALIDLVRSVSVTK